jgi:hypothetical protein
MVCGAIAGEEPDAQDDLFGLGYAAERVAGIRPVAALPGVATRSDASAMTRIMRGASSNTVALVIMITADLEAP